MVVASDRHTQEDRLRDWEQQRTRNRLFLVPFWGPSFFNLKSEAELANKGVLVAESSGDGIECHRFDRFEPVVAPTREALPHARSRLEVSCEGVMRHSATVRTAARCATACLAGGRVLSGADPRARAAHQTMGMLAQKAALYRRSRFCMVPPGDSYVTPRIYSFTAAACVPIFTMNRSVLPFQRAVRWERTSLHLEPNKLVQYLRKSSKCTEGRDRGRLTNRSTTCALSNPLAELLGQLGAARVRAMQMELLRTREFLMYRNQTPSVVHTLAQELQDAYALRDGGASARL